MTVLALNQSMPQKRKVSLYAATAICSLLAIWSLFLFYVLIGGQYGSPFTSAWNNTLNDSKTSTSANVTNCTTTSSNKTSSAFLSCSTVRSPTDRRSADVMVQASPFPQTVGDSKFISIESLPPKIRETRQIFKDAAIGSIGSYERLLYALGPNITDSMIGIWTVLG